VDGTPLLVLAAEQTAELVQTLTSASGMELCFSFLAEQTILL
jgi:hypothetical protein